MHYEHIKPGETISGDHYRQHSDCRKTTKKMTKHKIIIFYYNNQLKTIWKAAAGKICLVRFIVQTLTENSIVLDGQTFE